MPGICAILYLRYKILINKYHMSRKQISAHIFLHTLERLAFVVIVNDTP